MEADQQFAEIFPLEQAEKSLGRMFQPVDEIFTVLEFSLRDPCRQGFERLIFWEAKSQTMKPR